VRKGRWLLLSRYSQSVGSKLSAGFRAYACLLTYLFICMYALLLHRYHIYIPHACPPQEWDHVFRRDCPETCRGAGGEGEG